jgi:hypothetical protein
MKPRACEKLHRDMGLRRMQISLRCGELHLQKRTHRPAWAGGPCHDGVKSRNEPNFRRNSRRRRTLRSLWQSHGAPQCRRVSKCPEMSHSKMRGCEKWERKSMFLDEFPVSRRAVERNDGHVPDR